jgi:hypothetical protein
MYHSDAVSPQIESATCDPSSGNENSERGAAKMFREHIGRFGVSKTPSDITAALDVPLLSVTCRDAARDVPVVHGVETATEPVERHGDLNDVRKVALDSFRAGAAFVAHGS